MIFIIFRLPTRLNMKLQTVSPLCYWASHPGAQNCTCVCVCVRLQICHPEMWGQDCEPAFCHVDSELNSKSEANHKVFAGVYVRALWVWHFLKQSSLGIRVWMETWLCRIHDTIYKISSEFKHNIMFYINLIFFKFPLEIRLFIVKV